MHCLKKMTGLAVAAAALLFAANAGAQETKHYRFAHDQQLNTGYIQRHVASTYDQRNPNLFWIALLAVIAVLGSFVSRHAMRQGRRR